MNHLKSFVVLILVLLFVVPVLAQDEEEEELPECPVFEDQATDVRVSYYMGEGLGYLNSSQLNRALFSFTCITLVVDPDYLPAHMNRASINVQLRNYEDAIEDLTAALEIDSDLVQAYNNRGIIYALMGEYEDAAADFDQTLALDSNFQIGYNNRSIIHIIQGEYDEAEALLQQAITASGIDEIYAELSDPDRPQDAEDPEYSFLDTRAYALIGIVHSARALDSYRIYQFLGGSDGRISSASSALESRFTFELRLDDGSWFLTANYSPLGE